MKTPYFTPQLEEQLVCVEHGIAISEPNEFDLTINGFGEEQEW